MEPNEGNRTVVFEPGAPNFDMEAIATMEEETGLDLYLNIPYTSLVFVHSGDVFRARYEVLVRVLDQRGRNAVKETVWADTVVAPDYEATQQFEALSRSEHLSLRPGTYVVEMTMEDTGTGAQAVRRQRVTVPDLKAGAPALSEVRLSARREAKGFEPVVSVHLPGRFDSLRAIVDLYNPGEASDVEMLLLQFESDTAAAVPPHWFTPGYFTLRHQGIDYARADTVQRSRRSLRGIDGQVTVMFSLPALEKGNYRVSVTARAPGVSQEALLSERDFSVKGPTYPRITSLNEMIGALAYIARERELEHILAAPTAEEKKERFDAFWGALIPDRAAAAAAIKAYYSRVEEANVVFSTYKEGWKTDEGMVYIVLGPPIMVRDEFQRRIWSYSYGNYMWPDFIFEQARPYHSEAAFENYLLRRDPRYEEVWQRAVDRWRRGETL